MIGNKGQSKILADLPTFHSSFKMRRWKDKDKLKMNAKHLNIIGLSLGLIGVVLIFIGGPPQPNLEEGIAFGLEDDTPIDSTGTTVKQHDKEVRRRRARRTFLSRIGLGFVFFGFLFQLLAASE